MEVSGILLCSLVLFFTLWKYVNTQAIQIAVVGGGIGGTTSAHFLRQLFGDEAVIDLYEKGEIGGRLATVKFDDNEYEYGGSIIHPSNQYMVNFTEMLGLRKRERGSNEKMGIFDGTKMVFDGSSNDIILALQFFYHYGWDVFTINSFVKEMLSNFSRIYEHQNGGYSFTSVERLLESMSPAFVQALHEEVGAAMTAQGLSQVFVEQLVRGAMRTNYGQNEDIGAFVGSVSMAGIESGLWSVHGGNKLVAQKLTLYSNINVIHSKVKEVFLRSSKNSVSYEINAGNAGNKVYDIVVIATPLHDMLSDISFKGFSAPVGNLPENYQQRYATYVKGIPNPKYFGFQNANEIPDSIFTCNKNLKISSIGKQLPVDYTSDTEADVTNQLPVYKIFTNELLTEEEMQELFPSYKEMRVVDWPGAYPIYKAHKSIAPFELFTRLYYVNGIELAASAIEMSAIAGRNVALLAHAQWNGQFSKVDSADVFLGRRMHGSSEEL